MAFDRRETAILLIGDFLILVASLWVALLLRNLAIPPFGYFETNFFPFLPMFLLSLFVFYIAGLYEKQTRPIRRVMGPRIAGAQGATVAIAAILFFLLPLTIAPKTILLLYLLISVIAESLWRFHRMRREIAEGKRESATLVGSGPTVQELYDEVNGNDRYMIRFAHRDVQGTPARIEVNTTNGIRVLDLTSFYEEIFDRVPLEHIDSRYVLSALPQRRTVYDGAKRIFDILLALAGLVLAAPLILGAAIGRALTHTPAFVPHVRIGKDGKPFTIIKLGSMLLNDHGDPQMQKQNHVTKFGHFLRKSRIDELPQLWNILMGDLSFIGPRPELPTLARVYEREIPQYSVRHTITPGLSGWAQIHDYDAPRGAADVLKTRRKLSFDLYYVKYRSFALDLAIAAKSLRAVVAFSGT